MLTYAIARLFQPLGELVKVRLKNVVPYEVGRGTGNWLRPETEYSVLAVVSGYGRNEYRIATEQRTPALFDARLFDLVDGRLPATWVARANGEHLELQPKSWSEPGFWERFFDGEPNALDAYEAELRQIHDE